MNVVFDFGGVLFRWRPRDLLARLLPQHVPDAAEAPTVGVRSAVGSPRRTATASRTAAVASDQRVPGGRCSGLMSRCTSAPATATRPMRAPATSFTR